MLQPFGKNTGNVSILQGALKEDLIYALYDTMCHDKGIDNDDADVRLQ